jgi:hypothetical protein
MTLAAEPSEFTSSWLVPPLRITSMLRPLSWITSQVLGVSTAAASDTPPLIPTLERTVAANAHEAPPSLVVKKASPEGIDS